MTPFPVFAVPAFLCGLALAVALAILSRPKKKKVNHEVLSLGVPEVTAGTVYMEDEDGNVVRRSTRQRKPVTPSPAYAATPSRTRSNSASAEATPKAKTTPAVTPRVTRSKRAASAAAADDTVAHAPKEVEEPLSPKIRTRRTPRV